MDLNLTPSPDDDVLAQSNPARTDTSTTTANGTSPPEGDSGAETPIDGAGREAEAIAPDLPPGPTDADDPRPAPVVPAEAAQAVEPPAPAGPTGPDRPPEPASAGAGVDATDAGRIPTDPALFAVQYVDVSLLKVHDLAESVPRMPPDDFLAFVERVREWGIQKPLDVNRAHEIVDGRLRYEAAMQCGITSLPCLIVDKPQRELEDFIYGEAVHRRHLTQDQRAMMAAKWAERDLAASRSERARAGGRAGGRGRPKAADSSSDESPRELSADTAVAAAPPTIRAETAAKYGVPEGRLNNALRLVREAPGRADDVLAGKKSLREALDELDRRTRRNEETGGVPSDDEPSRVDSTGPVESASPADVPPSPPPKPEKTRIQLQLRANPGEVASKVLDGFGADFAARLADELMRQVGNRRAAEQAEVEAEGVSRG